MLSRISPDSNWTLCVMNYDRWLGTRRLLSRSRCADRSGKINAVSRVLQNLAWCCVIMQIDNNRCFRVSCHNQQMGLIVFFFRIVFNICYDWILCQRCSQKLDRRRLRGRVAALVGLIDMFHTSVDEMKQSNRGWFKPNRSIGCES